MGSCININDNVVGILKEGGVYWMGEGNIYSLTMIYVLYMRVFDLVLISMGIGHGVIQ